MSTFKEELDRLAAKVEEIKGVVPGVVSLIGEVAGKMKANATDPARIGQLADELDGVKVALANAIATGTAAADEAPPAPAPQDPPPTETPTEPKPEGETPPAG